MGPYTNKKIDNVAVIKQSNVKEYRHNTPITLTKPSATKNIKIKNIKKVFFLPFIYRIISNIADIETDNPIKISSMSLICVLKICEADALVNSFLKYS